MLEDVSLSTCETALKQIKSVVAARIKTKISGEIEEVHILARPGRNPKQVVRDIESVLEAQFGLQVDHKKISIAQMEEEEEAAVSTVDSLRPKLVSVTLRCMNTRAEARVELRAGEETLAAVAEGPASSHNKTRLLVEATLKAIASLTLEGAIFVPEDVSLATVAKHQVALVAITLMTEAGEQSLAGCALVKRDEQEAIVKAALDAVNRKLRFLQDV